MSEGRFEEPGYRGPGVLTAADMVRWRLRSSKRPMQWLPESAVFTHQFSMLRRRRLALRNRAPGGVSFDTQQLAGGRNPVALVACRGVGGPMTAIAIEEAAVVGVLRLICVDLAASIDPQLRSGEVVVIEDAIAADGTSGHYSPEEVVATDETLTSALKERLTRRKLSFGTGRVWSTDAAYRETPALIGEYGGQGAVLVDMDTATTLSVCRSIGLDAAAVLVVADELFEAWHPPRNMGEIRAKVRRLAAEAAACLRT